MTFKRRLFRYCLAGVIICFGAQAGAFLCYFSYEKGGKYLALPFAVLSMWPNFLTASFLPKQLPEWFYALAWPISCLVSLIGWVLLSTLAAIVVHGIVTYRRGKVGSGRHRA